MFVLLECVEKRKDVQEIASEMNITAVVSAKNKQVDVRTLRSQTQFFVSASILMSWWLGCLTFSSKATKRKPVLRVESPLRLF